MTEQAVAPTDTRRGADGATPPRSDAAVAPWWAWLALGFVFLAVVLEVVGGQYSNSPVDGVAATLHPLSWPQAGRVAWWLLVAAAAGAFRYGEWRAGIRRSPVIIGLSVIPFVIFAVGIALGASFSTWH